MLILDLWNGYRLQMEARRTAIPILGQFKAGHLRNAANGWRGYSFGDPLEKTDFHVLVEYLLANHVDEFCKSRLRKCFDGFAQGFHVVTENHGGK